MLGEEIEQFGELGLAFAGVSDQHGGAQRDARHFLAQPTQDAADALTGAAALHALEHGAGAVLHRDVEVGSHHRTVFVHHFGEPPREGVGVGVHHPQPLEALGARGERFDQFGEARRAGSEVGAVAGGVFGDQHDLAHALTGQRVGLGDHHLQRLRGLLAANLGNDAKGAAVIAAVTRTQVGVGARRLQQAQELALALGRAAATLFTHLAAAQHFLHHARDVAVVGEAEEGIHFGEAAFHLGAELLRQAARDDHAAQLAGALAGEQVLDRFLRLRARLADEGASIEQRDVGVLDRTREGVALGPESPEDVLGVNQVARAAQVHQGHAYVSNRCGAGHRDPAL